MSEPVETPAERERSSEDLIHEERLKAQKGARQDLMRLSRHIDAGETDVLIQTDWLFRMGPNGAPGQPVFFPGDRELTADAILNTLQSLGGYTRLDYADNLQLGLAAARDPDRIVQMLLRYRSKLGHEFTSILANALRHNADLAVSYERLIPAWVRRHVIAKAVSGWYQPDEFFGAVRSLPAEIARPYLLEAIVKQKDPVEWLSRWSREQPGNLSWLLEQPDLPLDDTQRATLALLAASSTGKPVPAELRDAADAWLRTKAPGQNGWADHIRKECRKPDVTSAEIEAYGKESQEAYDRLHRAVAKAGKGISHGQDFLEACAKKRLDRSLWFTEWVEEAVGENFFHPAEVIAHYRQKFGDSPYSVPGTGLEPIGLLALALTAARCDRNEAIRFVADWDNGGIDTPLRLAWTRLIGLVLRRHIDTSFRIADSFPGDSAGEVQFRIRHWEGMAPSLGEKSLRRYVEHLLTILPTVAGAKQGKDAVTPLMLLRGIALTARYDAEKARAMLRTVLQDQDFTGYFQGKNNLRNEAAGYIAEIHYATLLYPKPGTPVWERSWQDMQKIPTPWSKWTALPDDRADAEDRDPEREPAVIATAKAALSAIASGLWQPGDATPGDLDGQLADLERILADIEAARTELLPKRRWHSRFASKPDPAPPASLGVLHRLEAALHFVRRWRDGELTVRQLRTELLGGGFVAVDADADTHMAKVLQNGMRQKELDARMALFRRQLPPARKRQNEIVRPAIRESQAERVKRRYQSRRDFLAVGGGFAAFVGLLGGGAYLLDRYGEKPKSAEPPPSNDPPAEMPDPLESEPGVGELLEKPPVIGYLSRPLSGGDAYLVLGYLDRPDADGIARKPSPRAQQVLASLGPAQGGKTVVQFDIRALSSGRTVPLPLRGRMDAAGYRDKREHVLRREADGTLRMEQQGKAGVYSVRFSVPEHASADELDATASIAELQRRLPPELRQLQRPQLELGELPPTLQSALARAKALPAHPAAESLANASRQYLTYDDTCTAEYARIGGGPEYLRRILKTRRGVCGQFSALTQELLRQAGIPAVQSNVIWANGNTAVTTNDFHLVAMAVLPGPRGTLVRHFLESSGAPPQGSETARHVQEWQKSVRARGTMQAEKAPSSLPSIVELKAESEVPPEAGSALPSWVVPTAGGVAAVTAAALVARSQLRRKTADLPVPPEEKKQKIAEVALPDAPPVKVPTPEELAEIAYGQWWDRTVYAATVAISQGRRASPDTWEALRAGDVGAEEFGRLGGARGSQLLYRRVRVLLRQYLETNEHTLPADHVGKARADLERAETEALEIHRRGMWYLMEPFKENGKALGEPGDPDA
jgi:hypothetical protein